MNTRLAKKQWIVFVALVVLFSASQQEVFGIDPCRKPLPSPCAADGVCRPNTLEWGVSKTRWRPWPGDDVAIKRPTLADEIQEEEDLKLDEFQLPTPEEEELRGPAKKETPKSEKGDDEESLEEESFDLPGSDLLPGGGALPELEEANPEGEADFPDFDLQGKRPIRDDAPPALPSSLKTVAFQGPVNMQKKPARGSVLVNNSRKRIVRQTLHREPIQQLAKTNMSPIKSQKSPISEPTTAFYIED